MNNAEQGLKRRSDEYPTPRPAAKVPKVSKVSKTGGAGSVCKRADEDGWTEEQHKEFVSAVFEIGLRNSSPAVILENMTQKPKTITSERVKSKLQKYRNNREKSKQEFLEGYDAFLQRAKAIERAGGTPRGSSPAASLLEVMGSPKLVGGDVAAFLSYAVLKECESRNNGDGEGAVLSTRLLRKGAMEYVDNFAGTGIPFPELTESEKKSSLGVSMTFVMGLFLSMTQHLMRERTAASSGAAGAQNTIELSTGSLVPPHHATDGTVAQFPRNFPHGHSVEQGVTRNGGAVAGSTPKPVAAEHRVIYNCQKETRTVGGQKYETV